MKTFSFRARKSYDHCYKALKDKGLSETLIAFLRAKTGRILINSQPATTRSKVKRLDRIEIDLQDEKGSDLPASTQKLDILFENDALLVLNKPALTSCIPSRSHFSDNLANAVCAKMGKNFVYRAVGRLDRETSGIVVIAKDRLVAENLRVQKTYAAICKGDFPFESIQINLPISTISKNGINERKRKVLSQEEKLSLEKQSFKIEEKPALTCVKKVKFSKGKTLLSVNIETGRTHQIRVHLSSLGFPLLGDSLYGNGGSRALLHCQKAKITIPILNFQKTIKAPLPPDFIQTLNCQN